MRLRPDYDIDRAGLVYLGPPGYNVSVHLLFFFFFQAEDGIRDLTVTGVQTCALPISELATEARSNTPARALVRLCHADGRSVEKSATGDGPVDAAFKAIEAATGIAEIGRASCRERV